MRRVDGGVTSEPSAAANAKEFVAACAQIDRGGSQRGDQPDDENVSHLGPFFNGSNLWISPD
jgi:hypothetical protein